MPPALSQIYNKLNNYNYDDGYIDDIKNYLRSRGTANEIWPAHFSPNQKLHTALQYRDFELRVNNLIYYRPLGLLVVPESEKLQVLQDLYDDFDIGVGVGIKTLYNKITQRYLGIKRKDIEEFLPKQQIYQLLRPQASKVVNRPIIGTYPNQRWGIDLIDVKTYAGFNNHYQYILTCIDYFSKKVWARGILFSRAVNVQNALISICNDAHTYPLIIQSDNGPEFKNNIVRTWANGHNIQYVHTTSYTPSANGLIENFNGILRKMMRDGFLRNNDLDWRTHLQSYCNNRNDSKHSTTKSTPNELWERGRAVIPQMTPAERDQVRDNDDIPANTVERQKKAYVNLQEKAIKMRDRHQAAQFQVNDPVRILSSSINSKVRALYKAGKGKLVVVKYTPTIYFIDKVIIPSGLHRDFTRERYWLRHNNGQPVLREFKFNRPNDSYGNQYFFASDLQLVVPGSESDNYINNARANYLNRTETVEDKETKKQEAKEKQALKPPPEKKVIEVVDRSLLKRNKPNINNI